MNLGFYERDKSSLSQMSQLRKKNFPNLTLIFLIFSAAPASLLSAIAGRTALATAEVSQAVGVTNRREKLFSWILDFKSWMLTIGNLESGI